MKDQGGAGGAVLLGLAVPALAILAIAAWIAWQRLTPRTGPTPDSRHRATPGDDPCC